MTLVRNLVLFFVLFVPLTCTAGLTTGLLEGPLPPPRMAYAIGVFATGVLPLLLPSLLAVPVLHFAYRFWLRDRRRRTARWVAVLATPVVFLAVHLAFFGATFLGGPLLLLLGVAGTLYGSAFGLVRREEDPEA